MIFICILLALFGGFFGALTIAFEEKESLDRKTIHIIYKYVSNICIGISFGIFLTLAVEFIFQK